MITKNELTDLARFNHFKPHQQEKHYIQTIVLNSIYSTISDELVFKGGTCLLFFYGLNRFSEDLDFTLVKEFDVEKIVSNIKKDFENLGMSCSISKVQENNTSVSFKIAVEGPLCTKEIDKCFVKIEISKREKVYNSQIKELKTKYKDILGFTLNIMSKKEILAEKVRALITRNQARDLFDLFYLLEKNTDIDFDLINKKLAYYSKVFDKEEFKKCVLKKESIWLPELSPFILGEIPSYREVEKIVLEKMNNL